MKTYFLGFFCTCLLCACFLPCRVSYGQQQPETSPATITLTGKVLVQQHGASEWVVVHSKDAIAYLVTGDLIEKLKPLAQGQEGAAIVTLRGIQNGQSNISCERTNGFETDSKGARVMRSDARCIRYYFLDVTAIVDISQSDETIPEPRRDQAAEERAFAKEEAQPNLTQGIVGEIYGKIKTCNLTSVPKTLEIQNLDKQSAKKAITVIITAGTRIVKKIGTNEPEPLLAENFKKGQQVTVVYTRNEIRSEALFITVTKE